jgi:hypothetical protein
MLHDAMEMLSVILSEFGRRVLKTVEESVSEESLNVLAREF